MIKRSGKMTFLVMWYYCHKDHDHVMPMSPSMVLLPLFSQVNQIRCNMTFWSLGHVMPLAPVWTSYNANGKVNGTTAFVRSRQLKWCDMAHVIPMALVLASHDAKGIKNGTIAFFRSRQLKWDTTCFGHLMPLALPSVSLTTNSIINGTIAP